MLRNVSQYGVGIPPLARLRVLRTLLRNLFAGENPLGLEPPPLTLKQLSSFRTLARNQHLEDPFMTALMLNAYDQLTSSDSIEQRTRADAEKSIGELSAKWATCPLSVEEAHATIVLVDNIRAELKENAALFDALPLLHVHRHRERLLALYMRSIPLDAAERAERDRTSQFHLPWASSLVLNRQKAENSVKPASGELLSHLKFRRWLRPALNFFADDPVILMLALQLASRLMDPVHREAETAAILERLDDVDVAKGGWRLVHDDDERRGPARALARTTIELGLAQLGSTVGNRAQLWEQLLR